MNRLREVYLLRLLDNHRSVLNNDLQRRVFFVDFEHGMAHPAADIHYDRSIC